METMVTSALPLGVQVRWAEAGAGGGRRPQLGVGLPPSWPGSRDARLPQGPRPVPSSHFSGNHLESVFSCVHCGTVSPHDSVMIVGYSSPKSRC